MKRLLALIALLTTGCVGGRINWYGYGTSFTFQGVPEPRCAAVVLAATRTLATCPAGYPAAGFVNWKPAPFDCDGRMVWGCSDTRSPWVAAHVALPPTGHAADSAMPEEIAHWVWARCSPTVRTEWNDIDAAGKSVQHRDHDFEQWYRLVAATSRANCL